METRPVGLTVHALVGDTYREIGTWGAGETAQLSEPFAVDVPIDRLS